MFELNITFTFFWGKRKTTKEFSELIGLFAAKTVILHIRREFLFTQCHDGERLFPTPLSASPSFASCFELMHKRFREQIILRPTGVQLQFSKSNKLAINLCIKIKMTRLQVEVMVESKEGT